LSLQLFSRLPPSHFRLQKSALGPLRFADAGLIWLKKFSNIADIKNGSLTQIDEDKKWDLI